VRCAADRDHRPATLRNGRLIPRQFSKRRSPSAPLESVRSRASSHTAGNRCAQCCPRWTGRRRRSRRRVAHSPRLLQVHARSRRGNRRLPVMRLLSQSRGCARASRHGERRHRVCCAKKRILPKWWRALWTQGVRDKSRCRCPMGSEARSSLTRAAREMLWREMSALISSRNITLLRRDRDFWRLCKWSAKGAAHIWSLGHRPGIWNWPQTSAVSAIHPAQEKNSSERWSAPSALGFISNDESWDVVPGYCWTSRRWR
jgi:hypothetical protein